jgi:2-hydroxychromene-2-carboxylate isomerase
VSRRPARLEFFFDFSSPWTYMACVQVQRFAQPPEVELIWRPFYVAAVFRGVNHHVAEMRSRPVEAKLAYYTADMQRWADRLGIRIGRQPVYGGGSRPLNSARALRGAFLAIDRGRIVQYADEVFRAYWEALQDVSDATVLSELAARAGLDRAEFDARIDGEDLRRRLERNTEELIARGGFGTPTFFVEGSRMFFGNDRLDFVREALQSES